MPQLTQEQQKKQKDALSAGHKAYRALILLDGNPYTHAPYSDLWDKGWRIERKKDDTRRRSFDKPRVPQHGATEQSHPKKFDRKRPVTHGRPQQQPERHVNRPVVTERLIERFNRRHQTQV